MGTQVHIDLCFSEAILAHNTDPNGKLYITDWDLRFDWGSRPHYSIMSPVPMMIGGAPSYRLPIAGKRRVAPFGDFAITAQGTDLLQTCSRAVDLLEAEAAYDERRV